MCLVSTDDLLALIVHAVHIVFVSIVQLIHLPNQVVSLICQGSKIILKSPFLGLRIEGSLAERLKLIV